MRVMVLGGAGEVGAAIVAALADDAEIDRIVVADRDLDGARRAAAPARSRAVVVGLDLTDDDALRGALDGVDVVANAAGPFYRFGPAVLRAAIATGTDYVDVCDDPHPTLAMLGLTDAARDAGVTALIGMGASPGVANLLGLLAGRDLTTVTGLVTGWNIGAAHSENHGGTSAALRHGIHEIAGSIPCLYDGTITERPALQPVHLDYPGIGPVRGLSFGHPEAVTGHLAFPALRTNINVAVCDRLTSGGLRALRAAVRRCRMSPEAAAKVAGRLQRLVPTEPAQLLRRGTPPPIFAVATGLRDGRADTVAVGLAQVPGFDMPTNTAVPLATAIPLVHAANKPGVHVPETLLDPEQFFTRYARRCIGQPSASAVAVTTRASASAAENRAALSASLLTAALAGAASSPSGPAIG
ncbi:saccharopine dehydrogenase NADP-binding domain-containing protein [Gordonia sp. (in: high G+C Gram-positive bacteria)]|uniref:saccharopine dehydrogenase family protein n=1 Tax=Gordonia sp. (in: high G+C Gram-positive bacteria) TaxID=84139 RepID=UPI002609E47E|nr:saccharopine dehydrogenase NADP-binding domain-containing protein [Gordonia sp. (in: high G+C Gram-positive bacteria)]